MVYMEISSPDDVKWQLDLLNREKKGGFWVLIHSNVTTAIVNSSKHSPIALSCNLVISHHPVVRYLGVLVDSKLKINIVNTFQPKPQDHLTFFVTVYSSICLQMYHPPCARVYTCPLWYPHTACPKH